MSGTDSTTNRDTQFKNFAKLLAKELIEETSMADMAMEIGSISYQEMEEIIARWAYDLVEHACDQINLHQTCQEVRFTPEGMIRHVPDMTELPKEQEP